MWKIRKAIGEEAKEIIKLYNLAYDKPKTEEDYEWLYDRNPSGASYVWLAIDEDNGLTVSARPVFPWRMKILDNELIATQAGDALTHPNYRRRGIFTALVEAAWSELRERGIPLTYSFPIEASLSIHRKARVRSDGYTGCHEVGFLRRMVKPLQVQELLVYRYGSNLSWKYLGRGIDIMMRLLTERAAWSRSRRLIIKKVLYFDQRFDALWKRASKHYKVIAVRDSKFLNWRYIDTPKKRHTVISAEAGEDVLGFAVIEIAQLGHGLKEAYLVEVFPIDDSKVVNALLSSVMQYCRELNFSKIIAGALEGSDYAKILLRAGFISRQDRLPLVIHIHSEMPFAQILLDSKNWFITWGDLDIEGISG